MFASELACKQAPHLLSFARVSSEVHHECVAVVMLPLLAVSLSFVPGVVPRAMHILVRGATIKCTLTCDDFTTDV